MKKLILIPALWCILVLSTTSCSTGGSSSSSFDPQSLVNTARQGTWKVSNFVDSGTDETSHFAGYNFTFGNSNVITATNGTNTYTGNWSIATDTDDDDFNDELYFNIAFSTPADFFDLSDDWDVVSYNSSTIYLVDNSGGGSGTDVLVFTKN